MFRRHPGTVVLGAQPVKNSEGAADRSLTHTALCVRDTRERHAEHSELHWPGPSRWTRVPWGLSRRPGWLLERSLPKAGLSRTARGPSSAH